MHWRLTGVAVLGLSMAGCAGPDPLKDDFGESVRYMIRAQTDNPGHGGGVGLDGERAERTLRDYRGIEVGGAPVANGISTTGGM